MGTAKKYRFEAIVTAVYLVFAAVYFIPSDVLNGFLPDSLVRFRIAYPVTILALAAAYGGFKWTWVLAFVFSCTGDALGAYGSFIGQMSFFALAHLMLISGFLLNGLKGSTLWKTMVGVAVAAVLTVVFLLVIPCAPAGFLRIGCGIYAVLIAVMAGLSCMQHSRFFAFGALLFLLSDSILGWNKFVSPLPASAWLIMVPYYLGQLLLWFGSNPPKRA